MGCCLLCVEAAAAIVCAIVCAIVHDPDCDHGGLLCIACSRVGPTGVPEALTYPHFVELLGLLAINLIHGDEQCPDSLTKIQMLFFSMHERGGKFEGEEAKLVRNVTKAVKVHLMAVKRKTLEKSQSEKEVHENAVRDVLLEEVLA